MRRTAEFAALIPRNVLVAVLRLYRAIISPLYGDVCRYYPSCSSYALVSVQQHGVVRGIWLSARRLARCHPWAPGGFDDVPVRPGAERRLTRLGFVTASSLPQAAHSHSHGKG